MKLTIPELSLVVLVGASGSGKSTFAARHFKPTEVLSSDLYRALVADDPYDQSATADAFEVLHFVAAKRLAAGRLTVVDATNVQRFARAGLVTLARDHDVLPVAVVLDVAERICHERNRTRGAAAVPSHVIRRQARELRGSIRRLEREGFRRVFVLRGPDEVDAAEVVRQRAWSDRRNDHGPFDIVGDVHGCYDELHALLTELGYEISPGATDARHPEGRRAFFVGDLVDRGPDVAGVLRLAMGMVRSGAALAVPGNHEDKLLRALRGRKVRISHGLAESLEQIEQQPDGFKEDVVEFLDSLVSHYVLDEGRLVVAHAGMKEELQGRASGRVRSFALYGETTGETDEYGLPVRYPWADDYRGKATVVYGHTPVPEARWVNNTICIDTGCVFGGELTALRYPERELVSVPARRVHYEPIKPLRPTDGVEAGPVDRDGALDIDDVLGRREVDTRLQDNVTIREEYAAAALEVMSRFAVDPRWLLYLPPTMAPSPTSTLSGYLEHPAEAFAAYREDGVARVVCQEKHMGSRAVVVVCRDDTAATQRFGLTNPGAGVVHTRTGRPFFEDEAYECGVLDRVREAIGGAGLWEELGTDWLVLDCELMPWNVKATELLRSQYAAVGAAGSSVTAEMAVTLSAAAERGVAVESLLGRARERQGDLEGFVAAYRRYCWTVDGVDDLRLAPFSVLAGEGRVYAVENHGWHMGIADRLADAGGPVVCATPHRVVDVTDGDQVAAAVAWWEEATGSGSEGMVVKPFDAVVQRRRGLVQPGLKCRGREYLRIIYGPEYTAEANLSRLRSRALGHKSSLARRELALGIESLERFVRGEPLHRVHECVFAVLALESEPVDPRL